MVYFFFLRNKEVSAIDQNKQVETPLVTIYEPTGVPNGAQTSSKKSHTMNLRLLSFNLHLSDVNYLI